MMSLRTALFKLAFHEDVFLQAIAKLLFADGDPAERHRWFLEIKGRVSTQASWRIAGGHTIPAKAVYRVFYDWPFVGNEVPTLEAIVEILKIRGHTFGNREFSMREVEAVRDVIIAAGEVVGSGTFHKPQLDALAAFIEQKRTALTA